MGFSSLSSRARMLERESNLSSQSPGSVLNLRDESGCLDPDKLSLSLYLFNDPPCPRILCGWFTFDESVINNTKVAVSILATCFVRR
jgi:hypothetical protein